MSDPGVKNPIQLRFFERLRQSVGTGVPLAADLSELLDLSQDGIYRRLRGETVLSMDELVKICSHYKISPDVVLGADQNTATFQFRRINQRAEGLEEYLKNILTDIERIGSAPDPHIFYAAADIPLFHDLKFPELIAFNLFYWQRAVMNLPEMEGTKFSVDSVREDFREICNRILNAYIRIPSTEIWHMGTVETNLSMLEYAWDAGWFQNREHVLSVCGQLIEELKYVERQAIRSSKFVDEQRWMENDGNFVLYASEVSVHNNHILVHAGNTKAAYITYNSFNTMTTVNPVFVAETEAWMNTIKKKSIMINGVAEKQRNTFFRKAKEKVDVLMERINAA